MTIHTPLHDVADLSNALGADFDLEILQLSKGPFQGWLTSWPLTGVVVSHGRLERSVEISGTTNRDVALLIAKNSTGGPMIINGVTLGPTDVLATPSHQEHRFVLPESFRGVVLQLSHPFLQEAALPEQHYLPTAEALCSFAHTVADWGGELTEQARDALGSRCIELFLHSLQSRSQPKVAGSSLSCRRKAAMQAADLIHGSPHAPHTIQTLCSHTHVGERTLREGFLDVFGVPPLQYIMALRFNLVRRRLRQGTGGLTVAQAAAEQGFWHLPRFSGFYRSFFGELPSETLRQSLRAKGSSARSFG